VSEIRITRAPLDHGTGALIAALMKRLGTDRVTLDGTELGDGDTEVVASWDYAGGTVTLEVGR